MKVAVFGAGGIGGYFGARLAAGGANVHLLARGTHLEVLKSRGIRIVSGAGNFETRLSATGEPEDIGPSDVVLFCVKSTDTENAARRVAPLLHEGTAVITLQNGVENVEKLRVFIPKEHVCGGVAYIMTSISAPGEITHQGKLARMVFGEMNGRPSERLDRFLEQCRTSGIDAHLSENIRVELWRKLAMICATAGMTAAVRRPIGEIRDAREAFAMYERLAAEVVSVARGQGVGLPDDTVERIVSLARTLPEESYSSLHYDMTHGKPMELEALHGTVVRLAREQGVAVPACEAVFAILEPWAIRNR